MDLNKDIQDIKDKILNKSLFIKRVPPNTFKRFKEFTSNEEFCGDYGMSLKYLLDFHDGLIVNSNEQLLQKIMEQEERLITLEKQVNKQDEAEPEPVRRRINGRRVK